MILGNQSRIKFKGRNLIQLKFDLLTYSMFSDLCVVKIRIPFYPEGYTRHINTAEKVFRLFFVLFSSFTYSCKSFAEWKVTGAIHSVSQLGINGCCGTMWWEHLWSAYISTCVPIQNTTRNHKANVTDLLDCICFTAGSSFNLSSDVIISGYA